MKRCPRGTEIQTVIFDLSTWTAREARGWLLAHKFQAPRVDRTKTQLRYRQRDPGEFESGSLRTIDLESAGKIRAVVGCPRKKMESKKTKKNRNPAAYRWPRVVVQHGKCVECKVDRGDGKVCRYHWPKRGKGAMWLLTDASGRRLMIAPWNKIAVTVDDFMHRLDSTGATGRKALDQWVESTGDVAEQGSLVKVPERRIHNIGRAVSVTYYFDEKFSDGDPREHVFDRPPLVKADNKIKPALIVISGSGLEVTRAGIEG
jgi:hypothetical protein